MPSPGCSGCLQRVLSSYHHHSFTHVLSFHYRILAEQAAMDIVDDGCSDSLHIVDWSLDKGN